MRSTARWWTVLVIGALMVLPGATPADEKKHDHGTLPAGPIRDRHDLMESIGDSAKDINDAFNAGTEGLDVAVIGRSAEAIGNAAHRVPSLFPTGSTDPNSRALPVIWDKWDQFQQLAKDLEQSALALSQAAKSGQDENLKDMSKKMFQSCKACHDEFRRPQEKKK